MYELKNESGNKIYQGTGLNRVWARFLALCFVLLLSACGEVVNLQSGLNDTDANEIVSLLNRYGIETQKFTTKDGVTLKVKASDVSRATDAMRAAGLPKRSLSNLGQMFKKEGMISTPLEERVRYIHGLSQELEFTLQQFDNVISARVHVVLPERFSPGDPIQPSSAAVFIKHRLPFDEDSVIPRVRSLVSSSIPGLSGESGLNKVSVTLVPSNNVLPDAVEWKSVGPFTVQAGSAGWLYGLFVAVAILFVSVLGFVVKVFFFSNEDSKGAQFVRKYFGKGVAIDAKSIRDTVANSAEKVINSVKK